MQIKDKPTFATKPKPVTFSPEDTVQQAIEAMCKKNIGSIVIVDSHGTILGIVTERDMMVRVLGAQIDPKQTNLSKIMTKNVRIAQETDNVVDWMHIMSQERFRHLPVVDGHGKLVNVMSQGDFLALTWPDLYEKLRENLTGKLGRSFQILLVLLTVVTLGMIALGI